MVNISKARETYNLGHWSGGYFDINGQGHLNALGSAAHPGVDLSELALELRDAGLSWPVLVRFPGILHDRIDTLCEAFGKAMVTHDYQGAYTAVYPIKVNQQRTVVEEILAHGGERVGLEAGSKPELMAVLGLAAHQGVVVCNGYKDREYVRLALIGRRLGLRIYIVVEKLSELEIVIRESRAMGIAPLLGMRVRLASIGAGKWQNSGGEKSKFGLSAAQVLQMVERLREVELLDSLQLLHCHLGSQIANVRDVQRGMDEVARYFSELHDLGVALDCVDVGGGLGVDYEGTRSRSFCSMNYSVREYATKVVRALQDICSERGLPHPQIITESGRAMTAHHAVLITNVIDVETVPDDEGELPIQADEPPILHDLHEVLNALTSRSVLESYHDAEHWLNEARSMYTHGVLDLAQRARAESLYYTICRRVRGMLQPGLRAHHDVLDELNEKLADKYFCNLSLFQSLPDVWAIQQIFPIVPLQRLNEAPERRAVLQDITCDSDGRIDQYVDGEGVESTLPVHALRDNEAYLLGIFLVGAYQEILGDMHNLFGDTDAVNVELTESGGYRLVQAEHGDTVDELLRYVHFDTQHLKARYRERLDRAGLDAAQSGGYFAELEAGLEGYTYLED